MTDIIFIAKRWLSSNFEMKDLGEANYVLDVKIIEIALKGF
jgi:hypothetical protein